jgi:hypothetical protein
LQWADPLFKESYKLSHYKLILNGYRPNKFVNENGREEKKWRRGRRRRRGMRRRRRRKNNVD